MDYSYIAAIALGIALSACCGFRIFVPMLAASIAGYFKILPVTPGMEWMSSGLAITCFGIATIIEIAAYYLPFLDNLLDVIATPLSIIAGTVLASSILPLPENLPLLKWGMGLLAGGATAGTIQAGTGVLRLFTTKATVGTANSMLATGENAAAVTGSLLSFFVPVVIAALLVVLVLYILVKGIGVLKNPGKRL
jgi:Domain of unknown function (DUF4126)